MLCLSLSSCIHYGALLLPPDRISYNRSLQYSDNQQMLLNLVRLRYTDTPYFLSVNNIVAQFRYEHSLGFSLSNNYSPPPTMLGAGNGSIDLAELPTITYTPLQGEEYATRLLTPIDLRVVYTLLRAGWGLNEIFRLFMQKLGPFENAILASRTTSTRVPEYKAFHQFGLFLHELQSGDHVTVSSETIDNNFAIKIKIKRFNLLSIKMRSLALKYGFTAQQPAMWIVSKPTPGHHIWVAHTRTVLGIFNYLSKGIDIPQQIIDKHQVHMTYFKNGRVFDWRKLVTGQIHIYSSQRMPLHDYISIQYRNYWYYIAEDDFNSKETLNILSIIMGIYQGKIQSVLPVFTVN